MAEEEAPEGRRRPRAIVFDVNETLFGLDKLGDAFEEAGLPGPALDLWFARALSDGFALGVSGDFAPFAELARVHLARVLRSYGLDSSDEVVDDLLATFGELDAYEDVKPALTRVRAEGLRAVTLTNGSAAITRTLLSHNGLEHLVDDCFDVGSAGRWKPHPEPYRMACRTLDLEPEQVGFVAVHSWDTHGARKVGLTTAWVRRLEGEPVPQMEPAHIQARTLTEAVDRLLTLPA